MKISLCHDENCLNNLYLLPLVTESLVIKTGATSESVSVRSTILFLLITSCLQSLSVKWLISDRNDLISVLFIDCWYCGSNGRMSIAGYLPKNRRRRTAGAVVRCAVLLPVTAFTDYWASGNMQMCGSADVETGKMQMSMRSKIWEDYRIGTLSKINNIIYCKNDCLQSTTWQL